jgi:hypothetical protein
MNDITHYAPGVSYLEDEEGWRVVAGCGAVLYSNFGKAKDYTSEDLSLVDCKKCKEVYALEFLALVP